MKTSLLIFFLLPIFSLGQQIKISGNVSYFYNDYQGNKADVGAGIYIIDSSSNKKIDFNAIDSLIEGEYRYLVFTKYRNMEIEDSLRWKKTIYSKKKKKENQYRMPYMFREQATEYGVDNKVGYDKLDQSAMFSTYAFLKKSDYSNKADGVGNYSVNIKKPGTYYVLIQSANRSGLGLNTLLGNLYLEKINVQENEEKNVSHIFKLY